MSNDYVGQAKKLASTGDLTAARSVLEAGIRQEGGAHEAYQFLLDVLAYLGDSASVLECYESAVGLGYENVALNQFFFNVIPGMGEASGVQSAIDRLERIISSHEKINKFTLLSLSALYAGQGNTERAIALNQTYFSPNATRSMQSLLPPDFVVLGTVKGGTTSFYDYLVMHPKIRPALFKEIRFFNNPRTFRYGKYWYFSNFPQGKAQGHLSGEATPGYFSSPDGPQRMKNAIPGAKLFVCLRDPAARAISHYHMDRREGRIKETLPEILRRGQVMHQNGRVDAESLARFPNCISDSFYVHHFARWLKSFDRSQFHVVQAEKLARQPEAVLNDAFAFLGLEPMDLSRVVTSNRGEYEASAEVRNAVEEFLRPLNEGLDEMLGCDFAWLKK